MAQGQQIKSGYGYGNKLGLNRKRLDRRGRKIRLPGEVAAAVGKAALRASEQVSLDSALDTLAGCVDEAIADVRLAIRQREAARVDAVRALWGNHRLAMDRDFLGAALRVMHPAEIRPFVQDDEAESFRELVGEVWTGAAESREGG